jgi:hypothetical protein
LFLIRSASLVRDLLRTRLVAEGGTRTNIPAAVPDALLHTTDRQEALSWAYACAVAAGAGYSTSRPDFDRDSVDITFSAGGEMRPTINAQLKATKRLVQASSVFRFPLKKKNYDDLRVQTLAPRILIVLRLPELENEWLSITVDELVIRRAAYWVSLLGKPENENEQSVTIEIPAGNQFDVACLRVLMEKVRQGVAL